MCVCVRKKHFKRANMSTTINAVAQDWRNLEITSASSFFLIPQYLFSLAGPSASHPKWFWSTHFFPLCYHHPQATSTAFRLHTATHWSPFHPCSPPSYSPQGTKGDLPRRSPRSRDTLQCLLITLRQEHTLPQSRQGPATSCFAHSLPWSVDSSLAVLLSLTSCQKAKAFAALGLYICSSISTKSLPCSSSGWSVHISA